MDWKSYENIAKQVNELSAEQNNTKKDQVVDIHGDCDYVWAPEKGMKTILYIACMLFGSIFHARILVWIVATLIYFGCRNK